MDDARIAKLRAEVLGDLDAARPPAEAAGLEARVAALEAAVASLLGRAPRPAAPAAAPPRGSHPALETLVLGGSGDRCLMEPDKPCVQSHACRTFGH